MEDPDVWRAATQLIEEYGPDAEAQAVHLACKMLEHRDYENYTTWAFVWAAIKALQERDVPNLRVSAVNQQNSMGGRAIGKGRRSGGSD